MYLWGRLMEKWVKAVHLELVESSIKLRLPVTLGSNKYHTVINIGLVTLLLDGGPKLAVGIE